VLRQLQLSVLLICCAVCISLLLAGMSLFVSFDAIILATNTSKIPVVSETGIPAFMISTRGNTDYISVNGSGYGSAYNFSDITNLFESCPPEFVTFIHGWGSDNILAKERLDRVKLSLEKNNYTFPLVGFSWDSDNLWEPAKSIARENGPKLADFILDLKERCQDTQIRLIAHSIGARVILSTLDSLHKNSIWNNNNFTITSVHLLGAAVDDEEISNDNNDIVSDPTNVYSVKTAYGEAIENEVDKFHNLGSSEDNVLEWYPFSPFDFAFKVYPLFEGDYALGQVGSKNIPRVSLPTNYSEEDVKDEIKAIGNADAIGSDDFLLCNDKISINTFCQIKKDGWDFGLCNALGFCRVNTGDNHAGYIGFRSLENTSLLADDGAMNIVIKNWRANNIALNDSYLN
jgi:Alpha/beta hydrolase of unknown function (DUF900)